MKTVGIYIGAPLDMGYWCILIKKKSVRQTITVRWDFLKNIVIPKDIRGQKEVIYDLEDSYSHGAATIRRMSNKKSTNWY